MYQVERCCLFARNQYGISIQDAQQPMLFSRPKQKDRNTGEEREQLIGLIPELAYMTGLTDDMVKNFRIMKVCLSFFYLAA